MEEAPLLRKHGRPRNTKEWEMDPTPWGAQMKQRYSCAPEIQTMCPGRHNQLLQSTKMETAYQKWLNLRHKTYSKPCLCVLSSFA
jgi:hypothetical protein